MPVCACDRELLSENSSPQCGVTVDSYKPCHTPVTSHKKEKGQEVSNESLASITFLKGMNQRLDFMFIHWLGKECACVGQRTTWEEFSSVHWGCQASQQAPLPAEPSLQDPLLALKVLNFDVCMSHLWVLLKGRFGGGGEVCVSGQGFFHNLP